MKKKIGIRRSCFVRRLIGTIAQLTIGRDFGRYLSRSDYEALNELCKQYRTQQRMQRLVQRPKLSDEQRKELLSEIDSLLGKLEDTRTWNKS